MGLSVPKWFTLVATITTAFLLAEISSEKILVLQMFSSKSHKITYMSLIEELARRGHQIKIVSPVKPFKTIENVTEVYTFDIEEMFFSQFDPFKMKESYSNMPNPLTIAEKQLTACRRFYDLPQVKQLLDEEYDLIFSQILGNECTLGLMHKLKAPTVFFSPISAPGYLVNKIGGHHPGSFIPNLFLNYGHDMTFKERFISFGLDTAFNLFLDVFMYPRTTDIYREKLGDPDLPSVPEILGNTSLVLSNGHFTINSPKPYLPDVVDVGGIHSKPPKPLPKELEDFVSKSGDDGFILFSMGSIIKANMMPESKRQILLNAFSKLKQQVIWKWDSENMTDLPKNVKLSKWLPQQDLLGHPRIKMFITHCGGGGTEEAIYHGVPLIGIPMMGDQPLNAQQAKRHGFLLDLEWNELSDFGLVKAIHEVLINPIYRNNVKRLSTLFRDQLDDPLSRGVYWVEYVMRHKGAPHLRSAARKLNILQYHSVDVLLAYLAIVVLLTFMLKVSITFVWYLIKSVCFRPSKPKSVHLKKKRN